MRVKNQEIAKIFNEMARFLQIEQVPFKPQAYQKAAFSLQALKEEVSETYLRGGKKALQEIPGIGKSLSEQIEEYLKTGKIKAYSQFRKKLPLNMAELMGVEGLGPRKIKILYQKLGISNLKELEKAAITHKIAPLFGFGAKTEENILQGIEFLKRSKGRLPIGDIMPTVNIIFDELRRLPEVKKISLAGSLRRRKETIGDVDFLVVAKHTKKVMDYFVKLPGVEKIWGQGGTKASVHMVNGFDMDLRVVPEKSYGAALQYFTGSKEHNILTRRIAIDKGLKLSEYGVFKGAKQVAGKTEADVYAAIGLPFIEPEMREDQGEIDAALHGNLPHLVALEDITGDLHCHSHWNGGKHSIEQMAQQAMDLGYSYIGISDHTKFLQIEKGLDEKKLLEQHKAIQKINDGYKKKGIAFTVLHGCESNILNDGSIDISDEVLAQLDYVIAGVHSSLKMPKDQMMARITKAMQNPNVDIISHPTGRLVGKRDEYEHDFDNMLQVAKETGTILEINASPYRLDLRDLYIRRAKAEGVKMVIDTDAHQKEQMLLMEYGVWQARRGWAEKEDIINAQSLDKLMQYFKKT